MYRFQLGKLDYETTKLDLRVANRVIFMLGKYVSGTLGKILSDVFLMDSDNVDSIKNSVISGMALNIDTLISDIADSDPDKVWEIFELISSTTQCNSKPVDLNSFEKVFDVYKLFGKLADYHLSPFSVPFSQIVLEEKGQPSKEQEKSIQNDMQNGMLSDEKSNLKGLAALASA